MKNVMIRVVLKKPGQAPVGMDVERGLKSMQALIDGGYIEAVFLPQFQGMTFFCDEEGSFKPLARNVIIGPQRQRQVIRGNVFITGLADRNGNTQGLTPAQEAQAIKELVKAGLPVDVTVDPDEGG